jgi:hypothetical protein
MFNKVPKSLWRGVIGDEYPSGVIVGREPAEGILHPDFEENEHRKPDVKIKNGMVQAGGGTSLFDKDKFFKSKKWQFFCIPEGTDIDGRLKLTGPVYNKRIDANHYQIEVDKPLYLDVYKGALDNLARASVAKLYEDAH